ncbi:MAG: hypothetical protein D6733_03080, partial [Methanobacteriota archaeon]
MNAVVGGIFLKGALFLGIVIATVMVVEELGRMELPERYYTIAMRILTVLSTAALALLFYAFYLPDFNVNYVFSRVATDTPLVYRLSALWVGQEGVFMVWSWAIFACVLVYSERHGFGDRFNRRAVLAMLLLGLFFTALAAMMSPFKTTLEVIEGEALRSGIGIETALRGLEGSGLYSPKAGFVEGQGMNPVLMSPWMAIHPPIVFIAYAFAAIPFGVCLIHLLTGKGEWEPLTRQWARLAWIFLSAGLIIGSLWAYEELSFGGYWTWDPIETASLVPWITLTMFLHGASEHRRKGTFGIIAPVIAVLTTILIIYGTFITKSGIIKSTHAYARSSITPVLASAIFLSLAILLLASIRTYLSGREEKRGWHPIVSRTNAFYLTAIFFTLILLVLLWGITYPLFAKLTADRTVSIGKAFYNTRGYPFTAGVVLVMGFCLLLGVVKKEPALYVSLGALALSLVGYILRPTGSYYVDTFIPLGAFAAAAVFLQIQKELTSPKKRPLILKNVSAHLLHLGIALLLIGVVASGSLQKSRDILYTYPGEMNAVKDAGGGYSLKLVNLFVYQDRKGNWVQELNVTAYREGVEVRNLTLTMINDRRYGRRPKVTLLRG